MDVALIMQNLSIMVLPLLLAITLHEAGHAYAAFRLGDDTAYRLGRVTLNPAPHIDPIGTILIPGALILLQTGFVFGYAKPVPVMVSRLRQLPQDSIIVSLAGPAANIFLVILGSVGLSLALNMGFGPETWLVQSLDFLVIINALLAVFNMMPVPPLDGGHILMDLVSYDIRQKLAALEQFGIFIVLAIVMFIPAVISTPVYAIRSFMYQLVGII